ncbi:unnamed protein product [Rotaria sordida]|uniref:Uncharacterized protein n=1 Tax=Rotaria sordida TaxID=392033 RepID=A0A814BGP0_9BILA|nr:unnamed protein product [Rotaria sordida]CAF1166244.1 unnamed protein product [Rotaria sordida]
MFPQYTQRNMAGEIAIWLLITVGALLIPIIVIAVCCIRHHLARNPVIKLMESRSPHMTTMTIKQRAVLRSYNGPYMESGNDDRVILSSNKIPQILSCTNSINKKQHIHWPNGSTSLKGDDLRSIKDRQFTPRKQPFSGGDNFNTMMLNESPSSHRRLAVIPAPSSALSHLIQTAIIPAGSTITNASASLLLTPSKPLTPNLAGYNSTV